MKIGISTGWDVISGKNKSEESRLIFESFGSLTSYLQFIKDRGVTGVELRKFDSGLDGNEVGAICKKLKTNNFALTVHGEISENNFDRDLNATFPWLYDALRVYDDGNLIVVIHPIEGTKRTQDEYRELTVGKIRSMLDMIGHDQLNVHLALEINQFKMIKVSPGYTYDGILDIVTEVNSDHLGICFDLGHTYSNIRRGFLPPVIPDAFLRRVIHTHIHDLSPEYQTHWPLLYGNVPVGKYLKLLAQGHFKGILNLELIYDRFYTTINAKQAIDASLAKLNAILYKEEQ